MYSKKFIGLEDARIVAEAVLASAVKNPGRPIAVAVVDAVGQLIYLVKQDDSITLSSNMATNKAYTAVSFKADTAELNNDLGKVGVDMSSFCDPRFSYIPGGVCLKTKDGTVIGAVGVSGRTRHEMPGDKELAETGARALVLG